ncbi:MULTISPECIES: branched-chain amino acid ABC transporter permease [unclassified Pusillimonas]|uniref:branched-chain amino acid ABC transporter permease n=1 Tax=unclassified Pusillimonas TaxID=2640016 RepID=UPI000B946507|nr:MULTISPECIES: branched-chain amino acid ABC transporter permease [unclassified Pusillimonas]OXR49129.1 ABC transporter ATP-binding protein [Pusillimonas sp. T2]ROT46008.1 branched-chain amino acid ABC transporter permease [Pusillimonas sp. NJUB218]
MKLFYPAVAASGIILAAGPWVLSEFWLSLLMSCMMYVVLAVSWSMFSGATRYLSLATSALFGLGAYTTAWGYEFLPWPMLIVAGALVSAAFAAVLGAAVMHLRGTYFAILTFGMGELVKHSITYIEKSAFGTVGRVIMDVPSNDVVYWTVVFLALLTVLVYHWVANSRLGFAMRGIGADEQRAATFGVNPRIVKIVGFALTASLAGAIGAAMAVRWTYIDPHTAFHPFIGFQTVLIAMIGGAATLRGPLVAAIALSLLSDVLRLNFANAYLILLGTLLILSVLFMPQGIASVQWRKLLGRGDTK